MSALLEDVEVFSAIDIAEASPVSDARREANRRNATKSTGPKTEQGKDRSRRNALKDGLTGQGIVQPEDEESRMKEEFERWRLELQPVNLVETAMIESMVVAQARMRRAIRLEIALRVKRSDRASRSWAPDQRLEVQKLADKLRKTKNPGVVAERLRQTPAGCDWLIERWKELDWALDLKEDWNEECLTLAFDLLGAARALREFSIVLPADASVDEKRAIARKHIRELTQHRDEVLKELDAGDQERVADDAEFDDSAEARRLRSYDDKNTRLFYKLLDYFHRRAEKNEVKVPKLVEPKAEEQPFEIRLGKTRTLLMQAGLLAAPAGVSIDLNPELVGLSAEQLSEILAPGLATPEVLAWIRDLITARRQ